MVVSRATARLGMVPWLLLFVSALAAPRRSLLFNHVSKTGGNYAIEALRRLLAPENFALVKGSRGSTARHQRTHFVVASVCDPCSYYVSLFADGCEGNGGFRRSWLDTHVSGPLAAIYANVSDVGAFRTWYGAARGAYTTRLRRAFPETMAVDCWLRTSHLDGDLARCVRAFAAQGGALPANASAALVRAERGAPEPYGVPPLDPSSASNLTCRAYFPGGVDSSADAAGCAALVGGCTSCCGDMPYFPPFDNDRWFAPSSAPTPAPAPPPPPSHPRYPRFMTYFMTLLLRYS